MCFGKTRQGLCRGHCEFMYENAPFSIRKVRQRISVKFKWNISDFGCFQRLISAFLRKVLLPIFLSRKVGYSADFCLNVAQTVSVQDVA